MKFQLVISICIAMSLSAFCSGPIDAQVPSFVVEVLGESSGGKESTIAQVEKQARQHALRQAVEQAGVYLESTSQMDMAQMTRDEVASWAQGLVKVLEILESTTDFDPNLKAFRCKMRLKVEVQTQDMSELLSRVNTERTVQSKADAPLSLTYSFLGQRLMADGGWAQVPLSDGATLRSGDQFQISLRADRDCYAYVINQDASGRVYVLFPHEQAVSNELTGGRDYILPDRDLFYELDNVVGLETFYLAASSAPMTDLEWMIDRIEKMGDSASGMVAMLDGTLKTRGKTRGAKVASSKTKAKLSSGKTVEKVTEMMTGKGALVRVVMVDHR